MKKRDRIKAKYNGQCGYCGTVLDEKWQVDHGESKCRSRWNKTTDKVNDESNLIPACRICNHYKRSHTVEGYRKYMLMFHIRLGKLPKNTQVEKTKKRIAYMWDIATRYKITPLDPWSGVFHMDKYKKDESDI